MSKKSTKMIKEIFSNRKDTT